MSFPPDPDLRRPGHLRLVAVTLQSAMRRLGRPLPAGLTAELVLDGESFSVTVAAGRPEVRYGRPADPLVRVESSYEPLMAAAAGDIPLSDFRARHVRGSGDPETLAAFQSFMAAVPVRGLPGPLSDTLSCWVDTSICQICTRC